MNAPHSTRLTRYSLILPLLALTVPAANAQAASPASPVAVSQGVLKLSASASVQVPNDWMTLSFSVTRDGSDAAAVQAKLKAALDAALTEARRVARPGQVEVQTGGFSMYPRYGSRDQVNGWQGSTQLLVEGRDMVAISQLAGRVSSMTIAGVSYSLSREAREQVEAQVNAQAIARFRARAAEHAKAFGYDGYTVREVQVGWERDEYDVPMIGVASASARSADSAPLPTEAGKGLVTAKVSGSVQMR